MIDLRTFKIDISLKKKLITTIISILFLVVGYFIFNFNILDFNKAELVSTILVILFFFLIGISLIVLLLLWLPQLLLKLLKKTNLSKSITTAIYLTIILLCLAIVIWPLWPYLIFWQDGYAFGWGGMFNFLCSVPFYLLSLIAFLSIPIIFLKRNPILLKIIIILFIIALLAVWLLNI